MPASLPFTILPPSLPPAAGCVVQPITSACHASRISAKVVHRLMQRRVRTAGTWPMASLQPAWDGSATASAARGQGSHACHREEPRGVLERLPSVVRLRSMTLRAFAFSIIPSAPQRRSQSPQPQYRILDCRCGIDADSQSRAPRASCSSPNRPTWSDIRSIEPSFVGEYSIPPATFHLPILMRRFDTRNRPGSIWWPISLNIHAGKLCISSAPRSSDGRLAGPDWVYWTDDAALRWSVRIIRLPTEGTTVGVASRNAREPVSSPPWPDTE